MLLINMAIVTAIYHFRACCCCLTVLYTRCPNNKTFETRRYFLKAKNKRFLAHQYRQLRLLSDTPYGTSRRARIVRDA